ncbi:phage tail sheath subtilisin-like domain-containing protein [Leptolyngbya sp. FACHB-16]|uniref:phage tail sheath family protein n=1 Tax=unclassified Leptolyngbya TaxID=2650499 RepID=UPI001688E089|nr:phage tail sheath subtilisin-like domain-containing protein [Leptolyngbya sp. FACHB-16]MBD2158541.1 phage tail sheath family protein [Leptolyngbya sp. FACHB-16]
MPITPTYPGVYIEEIPSGVRTITGVATSITAFIGRALRGPVNQAVTINSFADFERMFGGLWVESSLGYAVRDFYLNGGSQAVIVRLLHSKNETRQVTQGASGRNPESAEDNSVVSPAKARLQVGSSNSITLDASSEGTWGNNLQLSIDHDVPTGAELLQIYPASGLEQEDLFNLTVRDTSTGITEVFRNLTVKSSPRQINNVLSNESNLVRVAASLPTARPDETAEFTIVTLGSDGTQLEATDFAGVGTESNKQGLYALEQVDLFNLLCLPLYSENISDNSLLEAAKSYCEKRRAFLLIDPPKNVRTIVDLDLGVRSKNAAIFYPSLRQPNPLKNNQIEEFAPCGAIAGVIARTDAQRGVWKAPAGLEASLVGVSQLSVSLTDAENGQLNQLGINCIRTMPGSGQVLWGARTLQGNDRLASEWKYIPVRRLSLYIQESLYRGTQWVVFEPNDESLWAQIRLNLGAFMHNLFRQGAFQGKSPREAYFVKCDSETTTQNDINLGIVNIRVGFAPLKPAEFVILQLQQMAGQI